MNFGIDAISFYTPSYYLDLKKFAEARGFEVTKLYDDLGQKKMSVIPPDEDVVTLALNAAQPILEQNSLDDIEMILFATESGGDFSKAAAIYVHKLFNLPKRCRVIELKQACYGATFGLQMGLAWLRQNTNKKILLIASDIARYELNSIAESSQGSGAVAMLLSAKPRLLAIENESGFCAKESMDFWRPNYLDYPLVDGRLSCDIYIRLVVETWQQYVELTGRKFNDHDHFCYHVPVPKLVESAHKKLAKINKVSLTKSQLENQLDKSLVYNREVGNCYTASLYLSIISLLENESSDLAGKLLGLYSYGSGSIGEFFAARVVAGYKNYLGRERHQKILAARKELSFAEYEEFHKFKISVTGDLDVLPKKSMGKFRLKEFVHHQPIYEKVE